jgi:hypothetical protein
MADLFIPCLKNSEFTISNCLYLLAKDSGYCWMAKDQEIIAHGLTYFAKF